MSTTIFISRDQKLVTKNAVADTIASLTQAKVEAASAMDNVFQELFETIKLFSIFVIDRLDRDRFMKLFTATQEARDEYQTSGPKGTPPFETFHQVLSVWENLLALMRADERFSHNALGKQ